MNPALRIVTWILLAAAGARCAGAESQAVPITTLAFSPDGTRLISNGARCLQVRSGTSGSIESRIECDLPKICHVVFHPRRPILAVAGGTPGAAGELRLLEWPSGKLLFRATNEVDLILGVAFNADGSLMATAGADRKGLVWRMTGGSWQQAFTLSGHSDPVMAVAFSPDGGEVITVAADRALKVWSLEDGRLLRSLNRHTERINAVVFRPATASGHHSPALCVSAGDDRTVRVWQPAIGRMVRIIRGHGGTVLALAFSPDGRSLFSAGSEGIVRRLNPANDRVEAEWAWHSDWIYALAVSPDDRRIASGDWSGKVRVEEIPRSGTQ